MFRFALVYTFLMAPWPGLAEAYGELYAASAALLFETDRPPRDVRIRYFVPAPASPDAIWKRDVVVRMQIRGIGARKRAVGPFQTTRSSRYTGYGPAALVAALVLATPIPWRRRVRALGCGLLLSSSFSALMVGIWVHGWFFGQHLVSLALGEPRYVIGVRCVGAVLEMTTWMDPYYVAPIFIWIAVAMRKDDLSGLPRPLGQAPTPESDLLPDSDAARRRRV